MIYGDITPGQIVKHLENGEKYVVMHAGSMRLEKGSWVPALTYRTCKTPTRIYTREESSFRERFTRSFW